MIESIMDSTLKGLLGTPPRSTSVDSPSEIPVTGYRTYVNLATNEHYATLYFGDVPRFAFDGSGFTLGEAVQSAIDNGRSIGWIIHKHEHVD